MRALGRQDARVGLFWLIRRRVRHVRPPWRLVACDRKNRKSVPGMPATKKSRWKMRPEGARLAQAVATAGQFPGADTRSIPAEARALVRPGFLKVVAGEAQDGDSQQLNAHLLVGTCRGRQPGPERVTLPPSPTSVCSAMSMCASTKRLAARSAMTGTEPAA